MYVHLCIKIIGTIDSNFDLRDHFKFSQFQCKKVDFRACAPSRTYVSTNEKT